MVRRRLSSTALFLGGLGLLSTGGVLVGTVLLTQEEYRFREVDRVTEEEPVRVMPTDTAATLEQQLPRGSSTPSAPPRPSLRSRTGASQPANPAIRSQPATGSRVRVDHLDEDASIVDGETLRRAIEEVEETLSPMMPRLREALSGMPGMGLRVSSAAGTATLDSQGFTVTDLALRQSLGLQVGDTIVSVNGHRVDGLESAWWIVQNLFVENRDLIELRLEIYRSGARLYKTYWIAGR